MVENVDQENLMATPENPSQQTPSSVTDVPCVEQNQETSMDNSPEPKSVSQESSGVRSEDLVASPSTNLAESGVDYSQAEEEEEGESLVPAAVVRQLQHEKDDLYDRLLRKQAEFENFRKRLERDKQDLRDYALLQFIKDLLPVIDGLERGLEAPDGEGVENFKKGLELILKQLREVLAVAGLQPIRAVGRIFDPNYHQAVLREETVLLAENEVIEELQRGYTFKDRLLRPSMVKVAVPVASGQVEGKPVETEA